MALIIVLIMMAFVMAAKMVIIRATILALAATCVL